MATILRIDDSTVGLSNAVRTLRRNGYRVMEAADDATAVAITGDVPIDAVLLNCQRDVDNPNLIAACEVCSLALP